MYRVKARLAAEAGRQFSELANDNIKQEFANVLADQTKFIHLNFQLCNTDLDLANKLVAPNVVLSTNDFSAPKVQHALLKVLQVVSDRELQPYKINGTHEIGYNVVTGTTCDHGCSTNDPHNEYRRIKARVPNNEGCTGCSDVCERIVLGMVHDISVDGVIDIMERKNASSAHGSIILVPFDQKSEWREDIQCTFVKGRKHTVMIAGNEHVYTHDTKAWTSWHRAVETCARRGYMFEMEKEFGPLKIYHIVKVHSPGYVTQLKKLIRHDMVRVPVFDDITKLFRSANVINGRSETHVARKIIRKARKVDMTISHFKKIMSWGLARDDKVFTRAALVSTMRALQQEIIFQGVGKTNAMNIEARDVEALCTTFYAYIVIQRRKMTKTIGGFNNYANLTGVLTRMGHTALEIVSVFTSHWDNKQLGVKAVRVILKIIEIVTSEIPFNVVKIRPHNHGRVLPMKYCPHGEPFDDDEYDIDHEYHQGPAVVMLQGKKVFCYNTPAENKGINCVTNRMSEQRAELDCSLSPYCESCMDPFDFVIASDVDVDKLVLPTVLVKACSDVATHVYTYKGEDIYIYYPDDKEDEEGYSWFRKYSLKELSDNKCEELRKRFSKQPRAIRPQQNQRVAPTAPPFVQPPLNPYVPSAPPLPSDELCQHGFMLKSNHKGFTQDVNMDALEKLCEGKLVFNCGKKYVVGLSDTYKHGKYYSPYCPDCMKNVDIIVGDNLIFKAVARPCVYVQNSSVFVPPSKTSHGELPFSDETEYYGALYESEQGKAESRENVKKNKKPGEELCEAVNCILWWNRNELPEQNDLYDLDEESFKIVDIDDEEDIIFSLDPKDKSSKPTEPSYKSSGEKIETSSVTSEPDFGLSKDFDIAQYLRSVRSREVPKIIEPCSGESVRSERKVEIGKPFETIKILARKLKFLNDEYLADSLNIWDVKRDGNCFYRCVASLVDGDEELWVNYQSGATGDWANEFSITVVSAMIGKQVNIFNGKEWSSFGVGPAINMCLSDNHYKCITSCTFNGLPVKIMDVDHTTTVKIAHQCNIEGVHGGLAGVLNRREAIQTAPLGHVSNGEKNYNMFVQSHSGGAKDEKEQIEWATRLGECLRALPNLDIHIPYFIGCGIGNGNRRLIMQEMRSNVQDRHIYFVPSGECERAVKEYKHVEHEYTPGNFPIVYNGEVIYVQNNGMSEAESRRVDKMKFCTICVSANGVDLDESVEHLRRYLREAPKQMFRAPVKLNRAVTRTCTGDFFEFCSTTPYCNITVDASELTDEQVKTAAFFGHGINMTGCRACALQMYYVNEVEEVEFADTTYDLTSVNVEEMHKEFIEQVLSVKDVKYEACHAAARKKIVAPIKRKVTVKCLRGRAGSGKSTTARKLLHAEKDETLFVCPTRSLAKEYEDKGYKACTVASTLAKSSRSKDNFKNIVLDEVFTMHPATIAYMSRRAKNLYAIGDDMQTSYGCKEFSSKYSLKDLWNYEKGSLLRVSRTVPRDATEVCAQNFEYDMYTNSSVTQSMFRKEGRIEGKSLCMLREDVNLNPDALTAPRAQGGRYGKIGLSLPYKCASMIKTLPSHFIVNFTRHVERLDIRDFDSTIATNLGLFLTTKHVCEFGAGGEYKVNLSGKQYMYNNVSFEEYADETVNILNVEEKGASAKQNAEVKIHVNEELVRNDEGEVVERNAHIIVPHRIMLDMSTYNVPKGVDTAGDHYGEGPGEMDGYVPQEAKSYYVDDYCEQSVAEILDMAAPSQVLDGDYANFGVQNYCMGSDSERVRLKEVMDLTLQHSRSVLRMPIKMRGRPYFQGNLNQSLHTAMARSRGRGFERTRAENEKLAQEWFDSLSKFIDFREIISDDLDHAAAEYLTKLATKQSKPGQSLDMDYYEYSEKIAYFPKIQCKKDSKLDSWIRAQEYEENLETKAGQSVCPQTKGVNHLTAAAIRAMETVIKAGCKNKLYLMLSRTKPELKHYIERMHDVKDEYFISDFVEFDTFHDEAAELFFHKIIKAVGMNDDFIELSDSYNRKFKMNGGSFQVTTENHLQSGRTLTLLKNTLVAAAMATTYVSADKIGYMLVCGDDVCIAGSGFTTHYPDFIEPKVKSTVSSIGEFVGFIIYDTLYLDLLRYAIAVTIRTYKRSSEKEELAAIEDYQRGVKDWLAIYDNDEHLERNFDLVSYCYPIAPAHAEMLYKFLTSYVNKAPEEVRNRLQNCDAEPLQLQPEMHDRRVGFCSLESMW
ncbi:replicase [Wenling hepe-like virus 3]|uniref:replicase n=1 Tax=Wenling hepe-like virus 3 TaxID=1923495 RepID=UPI00090A94F1|nr:replicase [Wenling hepe-like virus 3]APG77813.1 replicase [Wenling hepe-like virus 3]